MAAIANDIDRVAQRRVRHDETSAGEMCIRLTERGEPGRQRKAAAVSRCHPSKAATSTAALRETALRTVHQVNSCRATASGPTFTARVDLTLLTLGLGVGWLMVISS